MKQSTAACGTWPTAGGSGTTAARAAAPLAAGTGLQGPLPLLVLRASSCGDTLGVGWRVRLRGVGTISAAPSPAAHSVDTLDCMATLFGLEQPLSVSLQSRKEGGSAGSDEKAPALAVLSM